MPYLSVMMSANPLGPDCLPVSQRKLLIHYSAVAKRKLYFTVGQYICCASYCSQYQLSGNMTINLTVNLHWLCHANNYCTIQRQRLQIDVSTDREAH